MKLITAKELCIILNISRDTLSRWRRSDAFPRAIKMLDKNGKLLWVMADIEKWIKENKNDNNKTN